MTDGAPEHSRDGHQDMRGQCLRCGYDLRGSDARGACPECGLTHAPCSAHIRLPTFWFRARSFLAPILLVCILGVLWTESTVQVIDIWLLALAATLTIIPLARLSIYGVTTDVWLGDMDLVIQTRGRIVVSMRVSDAMDGSTLQRFHSVLGGYANIRFLLNRLSKR